MADPTTRELSVLLSSMLPRLLGTKQISAIDLAIMLYLDESPATLATLIMDLEQPRAVLSVRVDMLVAAKRVSRTRNQFDHRQFVLSLTGRGLRFLRTANAHHAKKREVTT